MSKREKWLLVFIGQNMPEKWWIFYNRIYIKGFRVLGGICVLCLLKARGLNLNITVIMVLLLFTIIFLVLNLIVTVIRIRFAWNIIKTGEHWFFKIIWIIRAWICTMGNLVVIYSLGVGVDILLMMDYRDPVIRKFIGDCVNKVLPPSESQLSNYSSIYIDLEMEKEKLLRNYPDQDEFYKELYRCRLEKIRKEESDLKEKIDYVKDYLERKS